MMDFTKRVKGAVVTYLKRFWVLHAGMLFVSVLDVITTHWGNGLGFPEQNGAAANLIANQGYFALFLSIAGIGQAFLLVTIGLFSLARVSTFTTRFVVTCFIISVFVMGALSNFLLVLGFDWHSTFIGALGGR